jgi:hypothetical protein
MANERNTNSIASLLSDVLNDIRDLFRHEVNLAKVEVKQEISNAKAAAVKIGAAVVAFLLAALFLLTALSRGLAVLLGIPIWGGFAIVGVLLGIVGGILLAVARPNLQAAGPVPPRTVRTVKENVEWVKRETS